jgi:hypothetical protein
MHQTFKAIIPAEPKGASNNDQLREMLCSRKSGCNCLPEEALKAKAFDSTASSGVFFTKVTKKESFPEGKDSENYTFLITSS